MWPFRKEPDPDQSRELVEAKAQLLDLQRRADRVHKHLRPRHERNHWLETVDEMWKGRPA